MKIKHVFESSDISSKEAKEILSQPFFKQNGCETFLAHGTTTKIDSYELITNKKDRDPANTALYVHNFINKLAKEKFGINVRSETVFAYPKRIEKQVLDNPAFTNTYSLYVLVPKGDYKMFYNKAIYDMTVDYRLFPITIVDNTLATFEDFCGTKVSNALKNIINHQTDITIKDYDEAKERIWENFKLDFKTLLIGFRLPMKIKSLSSFDDFNEVVMNIFHKVIKDQNIQKFEFPIDGKVYQIDYTQELFKAVQEAFQKAVIDVMGDLKNKLEGYVHGLRETDSIDTDWPKSEYMVYCDEFWLINFTAFVKMIKANNIPLPM